MIKETIKERRWFRLDNAAKIYPVIQSAKNSGIYRMSVFLDETIDPSRLRDAVMDCRDRFPAFFVKLHLGLFWYYTDANDKEPLVVNESPFACRSIMTHKNNGFMFSFFYYENKISLEMFHSLSDGGGAFEFFKLVLYRYLEHSGHTQINDGTVFSLLDFPSLQELEDSYNVYYTQPSHLKDPFPVAYRISGKHFLRDGISITSGRIPTHDLYAFAKSKNASISQIIVANWIQAIIRQGDPRALRKHPITISVPVNLRKYFSSYSIRNFSLYFNVTYHVQSQEDHFDLILDRVKRDFSEQLTKDKLQERLNKNVSFERNFLVRICPLFLKKLMFKIGYALIGHKPITSSVTNFGNVALPETMRSHIEAFEFNLASGTKPGIAVVSYDNVTAIVISSCFKNSGLEQTVFQFFGKENLSVRIHTNNWE
jgi:hypothetical protein